MALTAAGLDVDPPTLNDFMVNNQGFGGLLVKWDDTVRNYSAAQGTELIMANSQTHIGDWSTLEQWVCAGNPVIAGVELNNQGVPAHFVFITGVEEVGTSGEVTADLFDPGGHCSTLNCTLYHNEFSTRGYVSNPSGQNLRTAASSTDISGLDFLVPSASLVITSPSGKQTSANLANGKIVENIPQSVASIDVNVNEVSGAPPTVYGAYIDIFQPAAGTYKVSATASTAQPTTLYVNGFSQDGSAQPPISLSVKGGVGVITTFQVKYSPTTGAVLQVIG